MGVVHHLIDIGRRVDSVGGYLRPTHPLFGVVSHERPRELSLDLDYLVDDWMR